MSSPSTKLRRPLALVLAAGSLAVGVPAALAAGGDSRGAAGAPATAQPVQEEQQPRGDRGDCPERDGNGSGADAPAAL